MKAWLFLAVVAACACTIEHPLPPPPLPADLLPDDAFDELSASGGSAAGGSSPGDGGTGGVPSDPIGSGSAPGLDLGGLGGLAP